jgi:hypothetical protein
MIGKISLSSLLLFIFWSLSFANSDQKNLTTEQKTAVGYYRNLNNNLAPLSYASTNNGASWSLGNPLPLPSDVAANGSQQTELYSTSCDTTGKTCNAVGFYLDSRNNITPLSYTTLNGGKTWSLSTRVSLPNDLAITGIQSSQLTATTCNSTGLQCLAVGFYLNNSNNILPFTYTSTNGGATWSLKARLPLPADVAANGIQNTKLRSVTCDSTGVYCNAVGFYLNSNNNLVPLSYTSANGGATWTVGSAFALPANVAATGVQASRLMSES